MKAKLASIWTSIKADAEDTWNRSKIFLLAIAALIIALEFQKLKEFLLMYMGKKEIANSEKEDQQLAAQEHMKNTQADILVKQAENLPSTEHPIKDGWEKN